MSRSKKDQLTQDVMEQLIGDPNDDGMPVILAKRLDPQIPTTNNLRDYGFEGLRSVEKDGGRAWEPFRSFVLVIDGETGNCRIPDTVNNRHRLERLTRSKSEIVRQIVWDDVHGVTKEVDKKIQIPPTYQLMEKNLAQSAMVQAIAAKVAEMMNGNKVSVDESRLPPIQKRRPAPSRTKPKKENPSDDVLEPIR